MIIELLQSTYLKSQDEHIKSMYHSNLFSICHRYYLILLKFNSFYPIILPSTEGICICNNLLAVLFLVDINKDMSLLKYIYMCVLICNTIAYSLILQ